MKILIITGIFPPDIGGPATYSKLISEELPHYWIKTDIVVFSDLKKYPKIIRHFIFLFRILRKSKGIDLYYAQDPVSVGLPTLFASFLSRKKYILKIVGDYAWEQGCQRSNVRDLLDDFSVKKSGYGFLVSVLKHVQKIVASHAYRIIVPSRYLKKIVSNWGIKGEKISVIYNSFEFSTVLRSKEEYRKSLGLEGKIIITAGRLVPWKGIDTLIKVIGKMSDESRDIHLIVAGSGPDQDRLSKIAEENEYKNIQFTGGLKREVLFQYLRSADVFALNTSYEGFSHQLLEVMAIGLPILTTSVGGNVELIENDKSGILVRYNDEKQIRDSLMKMLHDESLTHRLASEGLLKIKGFSKDKMLQELSDFMHTIQI